MTIRKGTLFEKSHLELRQILWIVACWSRGLSNKFVVENVGIAPRIVVDWYNFCRDIAA
jgi:hypothetical protein